MEIRAATNSDQQNIHRIYWAAFPKEERELVTKLAVNLRSAETTPKVLSFVAEAADIITGHVAFSPISFSNDGNGKGYILAPLAVAPDSQKQGIGSQLVQHGIQQLSQLGIDVLLVYGDPKYYSRFGFSEATAQNYIPPYELQYPFGWQGLMLSERPPIKSPAQITCVDELCDPSLW